MERMRDMNRGDRGLYDVRGLKETGEGRFEHFKCHDINFPAVAIRKF